MHPKLTHVTFSVKNFDESIEFYRKWFQLEVHRDRRPYTVWLTTKTQNVKKVPEFILVLEEGAVESGKINHFGLQIEERRQLDIIADEARKLDILVEGPTDVGGIVGSFVMIKDPNGHIWEFTVGQPLLGL